LGNVRGAAYGGDTGDKNHVDRLARSLLGALRVLDEARGAATAAAAAARDAVTTSPRLPLRRWGFTSPAPFAVPEAHKSQARVAAGAMGGADFSRAEGADESARGHTPETTGVPADDGPATPLPAVTAATMLVSERKRVGGGFIWVQREVPADALDAPSGRRTIETMAPLRRVPSRRSGDLESPSRGAPRRRRAVSATDAVTTVALR
jgi:hypothetical protein